MGTLSYRNNAGVLVNNTTKSGSARTSSGLITFTAGGGGGTITPPTFVNTYKSSDFTATTTPKTVSIPSLTVGEVLLVGIVAALDSGTFAAPSGITGSSFTKLQDQQLTDTGICGLYACTVASAGTFTLSVPRPGNSLWGFICARWSGSGGVGASAKGAIDGGLPSLSLTTQQDHSSIFYIESDFWATNVSGLVWRTVNGTTPTAGNGLELHATKYPTNEYTVYSCYYPDAGTAGAKTLGLSAPIDQGAGFIGVEIKGL